ncbi:MAG: cation:proton antiporter [Clostridium sp.]|nr:cation:proton antiporter [Acetatifactor muris]MCM1526139.1 cation:proton antiporter [Bacteroides sp.]MCM1562713.1 cation:proton antiporter [Clostridium sp.]
MTESADLFLQARNGLFMVVLIALGILFFASLARAVKGPRVADRLVAVNMIGTMVMVMIAILSLYLQEDYLLDIGLIYAMASFLAVILLAKVYIGIYEEQHLRGRSSRAGNPKESNPREGNSKESNPREGDPCDRNPEGGSSGEGSLGADNLEDRHPNERKEGETK